MQRHSLGAQLGQWRHEGNFHTEQMIITGHDLPDRVQTLSNRGTVRGSASKADSGTQDGSLSQWTDRACLAGVSSRLAPSSVVVFSLVEQC